MCEEGKMHSRLMVILLIMIVWCMGRVKCMAAGGQAPIVEQVGQEDRAMVSVTTDAPQYLLEWDTDSKFIHKEAFALYKGRNYDMYIKDSRQLNFHINFPREQGCYYVRAYGVYPDGKGGFVLSRASKKLKIFFSGPEAGKEKQASAGKEVKIAKPGLRASYMKRKGCIKVTLTLPRGTEGYMLECSGRKSFSYKKAHLLSQDNGKYMVLWNLNASKGKRVMYIPVSEFSVTKVYIRLYAMGGQKENGENVLSKPSDIVCVHWNRP